MLILGVLVLLAQAEAGSIREAPGGGGGDSPFRACQPVQVSSSQQRGLWTVFSASGILDLRFTTLLRGAPEGPHALQIKVFTPRGYLYQTLATRFTGDVVLSKETRADASPRQQSPRVASATLPVAGTAIMANSLYGRWTVVPFLDGVPCGAPRAFVLNQ